MIEKRPCAICDNEFTVDHTLNRSGKFIPKNTKYCSDSCRKKAGCQKTKRYNERNPELVSQRKKTYRTKQSVIIKEAKQKREWEKAHPDRKQTWDLRYRQKHAIQKSIKDKKYKINGRETLSDVYIKKLLMWGNNFRIKNPPQWLIELKRKQLKLQRTYEKRGNNESSRA